MEIRERRGNRTVSERMIERTIVRGILAGMLSLGLAVAGSAQTRADGRKFEDRLLGVADQLNGDFLSDPGLAGLYAQMLGEEYGTAQSQFVWALDQDISWGQIAILSYVQATTGSSFEKLAAAGAHLNAANTLKYATGMEMSHDKMTQSLEGFAARAVEERNSRIFDLLRVSRRADTLPDLGAGFGLFQEALNLRELGPADPIKVHSGSGFSKGGQEN